jgi:hypothetical protein
MCTHDARARGGKLISTTTLACESYCPQRQDKVCTTDVVVALVQWSLSEQKLEQDA